MEESSASSISIRDDSSVSIQAGANCCGKIVVRALLHQIELTSRQEVDAMVKTLMRAPKQASHNTTGTKSSSSSASSASSASSSSSSSSSASSPLCPSKTKNKKTATATSTSTSTTTRRRGRCILDIEQCVLNRHMEDLLREMILKRPDAFDGLDLLGEDESAQAARLELISNSHMRFLPPASMSLPMARVLRDALRGNRGRLDYVSLSSMPITPKAANIIFEQGLKTTRRNPNLGGLMLRGCAFPDEEAVSGLLLQPLEDFDSNTTTSAAHHSLARGLQQNTTLKFLDVSLVFWTDRQLAAILNAIVGHPSLTKLDLEGSVVGPLSLRALRKVLSSPRCRVKALDLSHLNHVRDIGQDSELTALDKEGLMDALDQSHSLEQVMLNHNNCCSYLDLCRIIRLLRRHAHICQLGIDDFLPDGTARMKTIGLRSTIRALLHQNRTCSKFIWEASRAGSIPAVWPHCLGRVNRILRTHCQRAHALFPLVQAFFGVPGAIHSNNGNEEREEYNDAAALSSSTTTPIHDNNRQGQKRKR